jgi:hypothetical protein
VFTQAPLPHSVSPAPQPDWHILLLHTCPPLQLVAQSPQRVASEATQAPLQASRPALHWHWLAWQV